MQFLEKFVVLLGGIFSLWLSDFIVIYLFLFEKHVIIEEVFGVLVLRRSFLGETHG